MLVLIRFTQNHVKETHIFDDILETDSAFKKKFSPPSYPPEIFYALAGRENTSAAFTLAFNSKAIWLSQMALSEKKISRLWYGLVNSSLFRIFMHIDK